MSLDPSAETNEVPHLKDADLESPDMPDFVAIVMAHDYQFNGPIEEEKGAFITQIQEIAERYGQKPIAAWVFDMPGDGQKVAVAVPREERNEEEMYQDLVHHCDYTTGVWRIDIEGLRDLKDELTCKGPENTEGLDDDGGPVI